MDKLAYGYAPVGNSLGLRAICDIEHEDAYVAPAA
jgi:hypothetical protein